MGVILVLKGLPTQVFILLNVISLKITSVLQKEECLYQLTKKYERQTKTTIQKVT